MKELVWLGESLQEVREWPEAIRRAAGHGLDLVQRGQRPSDCKSMPGVGRGVQEIRLRSHDGIFRIVYVASYSEAIYVLHAFQKKSQKTSSKDLGLVKSRLAMVRAVRQDH